MPVNQPSGSVPIRGLGILCGSGDLKSSRIGIHGDGAGLARSCNFPQLFISSTTCSAQSAWLRDTPGVETGRHLLLPGARSKRTLVDLHIVNLLGFLLTKLICQEP